MIYIQKIPNLSRDLSHTHSDVWISTHENGYKCLEKLN